MSETAEQQRIRLEKKRVAENEEQLIKCLECSLTFVRVGSHVIQVHGYQSAQEYRKAHGLDWKTGKATAIASHRNRMGKLAKENGTESNIIEKGAPYRFVKGGRASKIVTEYWKEKHGRL